MMGCGCHLPSPEPSETSWNDNARGADGRRGSGIALRQAVLNGIRASCKAQKSK